MKNIVAKIDVHTLDNGWVVCDRSTSRVRICVCICAIERDREWVRENEFKCIVPMACIIGFTNYKAASLWCCENVFRRIDIEHTEKRVHALHLLNQVSNIWNVCAHSEYREQNICEKNSRAPSDVGQFVLSLLQTCFLYCPKCSVSAWTLIFSFFFVLLHLRCSFSLLSAQSSRLMWNTISSIDFIRP